MNSGFGTEGSKYLRLSAVDSRVDLKEEAFRFGEKIKDEIRDDDDDGVCESGWYWNRHCLNFSSMGMFGTEEEDVCDIKRRRRRRMAKCSLKYEI